MKKQTNLLFLSGIFAILILSAGCGSKALATYNNGRITSGDLAKLSEQYFEGREVPPNRVEQIVREVVLSDILYAKGNEKELRKDETVSFFLDTLLPVKVWSTLYYQNAKQELANQKQTIYKVSQIMIRNPPQKPGEETEQPVDGRKKADEAFAKIEKGEMNFAEAAKKYSEDKKTADKGGSLGYMPLSIMPKEMAGTVERLVKDGKKLSAPVQTVYGYQIFLIEGKKTVNQKSFAKVWKSQNPKNKNVEREAEMIWNRSTQKQYSEKMRKVVDDLKVNNVALPEDWKTKDVLFDSEGIKVTRAEFESYMEFQDERARKKPEDSQARSWFARYVREKAMANLAEKELSGRKQDYDYRYGVEKRLFLVEETFRKEVLDKIEITDEELKTAYDARKKSAKPGNKLPSFSEMKDGLREQLLRSRAAAERKKWQDNILKEAQYTFNAPEKKKQKKQDK